MCGRGGVAGAVLTTSPRLCKEKLKQAMYAKNEEGTPVLLL